MRAVLAALPLFVALAIITGCAGTDRQPDCHGPWTPINATQQVPPHD